MKRSGQNNQTKGNLGIKIGPKQNRNCIPSQYPALLLPKGLWQTRRFSRRLALHRRGHHKPIGPLACLQTSQIVEPVKQPQTRHKSHKTGQADPPTQNNKMECAWQLFKNPTIAQAIFRARQNPAEIRPMLQNYEKTCRYSKPSCRMPWMSEKVRQAATCQPTGRGQRPG